MRDQLYRGVQVFLNKRHTKEIIDAVQSGSTASMKSAVQRAMESNTRDAWWSAEGSDGAGTGRWWSSSKSVARQYAGGHLFWSDQSYYGIEVVLTIEVDSDEWNEYAEGDAQGTYWYRVPAGLPLEIVEIEAIVPSRDQVASMVEEIAYQEDVVNRFGGTESPSFGSPSERWTIDTSIRATSAVDPEAIQFEVEKNVAMRGVSRGGRRLWAIVDGHRAGSITYKETNWNAAHIGMIRVHDKFQRQGIGMALMERFHQMYQFVAVTPWTGDGSALWDAYRAKHPDAKEPMQGYVSSKTSALDNEARISVAEHTMENAGMTGGGWSLWSGHVDDPDYNASMADVREFVRQVTGETVRVHVASDYVLQYEMGGAQAMVTGTGTMYVRPGYVSELTVLHECAHVMNWSTHGEGHDDQFIEIAADLYGKHLGQAAQDQFLSIVDI